MLVTVSLLAATLRAPVAAAQAIVDAPPPASAAGVAPAPRSVSDAELKEKDNLFDLPKHIFQGVPVMLRNIDPRDHVEAYVGIAALTVALIIEDQHIIDRSQAIARNIGLLRPHDDGRETKVLFKPKIFGIGAPLNLPTGTNSSMYYLGDGLTTFAIAGGLLSYGFLASSNRAISTASQVIEAIALAGLFVITGKMSTGRESPFRATAKRGKTRGFVGFKNYLSDTSAHDAFPSGHIATAMATVRVLAENFVEKKWILPVGFTAMGLLMWAMLNNGEHWASDYPLGIAIGYSAAGVVLARHDIGKDEAHAGGEPRAESGLSFHVDDGYYIVKDTWNF